MISKGLNIILSNYGLTNINPISFSSVFIGVLYGSCVFICFACIAYCFGFSIVLASFLSIFALGWGIFGLFWSEGFLPIALLLGLLPSRGCRELRLPCLTLDDFYRLRLDCDLLREGFSFPLLFWSLSRLVLGTFFWEGLGASLSLEFCGLRLRLLLLLISFLGWLGIVFLFLIITIKILWMIKLCTWLQTIINMRIAC